MVRYVGITRVPLPRRLSIHLSHAKLTREHNRRAAWIRSVVEAGERPVIARLEETDDPARECYWIRTLRESGACLVNASDGLEAHIGYVMPESTKVAIGLANRRPCSPEKRAQIKVSITGRAFNRHANKTHCPRGHEYNPENTRLNVRGAKECRACERERYRETYKARRLAKRATDGSISTPPGGHP